MRGSYATLLAAARFHAPLIVFVALGILALRQAEFGVGFVAGCVFALALALHTLVFGAGASRRAFPPMAARLVLAAGFVTSLAGALVPTIAYAAQLVEGGTFAAMAGGVQLLLIVLFGRAPTLRDGDAT